MEQQEILCDGKHTPQNISLYSFCFGTAFGGCLAMAYYSETIPQLGIFLAALALFHELEYMMTALFKPDSISLDGQNFYYHELELVELALSNNLFIYIFFFFNKNSISVE